MEKMFGIKEEEPRMKLGEERKERETLRDNCGDAVFILRGT